MKKQEGSLYRVEVRQSEKRYLLVKIRQCVPTRFYISKNDGDCQIDVLNGFNGLGIIRVLAVRRTSNTAQLVEQIRTRRGQQAFMY